MTFWLAAFALAALWYLLGDLAKGIDVPLPLLAALAGFIGLVALG